MVTSLKRDGFLATGTVSSEIRAHLGATVLGDHRSGGDGLDPAFSHDRHAISELQERRVAAQGRQNREGTALASVRQMFTKTLDRPGVESRDRIIEQQQLL